MSLILNIDHPPTVFPSAYRLATNDHVPLRSNNGEWNHVLRASQCTLTNDTTETYPDALVELNLLFIVLISIKWIEADAMMEELCPDLKSAGQNYISANAYINATWSSTNLLFEGFTFFQSETVGLGNDRNDVDNFAEFFHDNHIYRTERMSSWVDEVQAAVDARVLDVTVTHRRELLAKVCTVLVFDIFHNWIPATILITRFVNAHFSRDANWKVTLANSHC